MSSPQSGLPRSMAAASSTVAVPVAAGAAVKEKDRAKANEYARMSKMASEVNSSMTLKRKPLSAEMREQKVAELEQYHAKLPPTHPAALKLRALLDRQPAWCRR